MKSLVRIRFDSNNGEWRNAPWDWYALNDAESVKDLAAMGDELKEGAHVILFMSDLEVEAVLEFDTVTNAWAARPMWKTARDLDPNSDCPNS